ncbi:Na+/H+ antiporter NhaA [Sphingobium sp. Leaf26]|uniref:Na+/H+ antiporter NhaA n=1 Tax=Sphingobium sp. Leaf26 TaxID=1735693 RepID=UPI0009E83314
MIDSSAAPIAALGSTAGIGVTISLFTSGLAFSDGRFQEIASLAIIAASVMAGVTGHAALRGCGARIGLISVTALRMNGLSHFMAMIAMPTSPPSGFGRPNELVRYDR